MRSEYRLAAEFDAFGSRIGAAARGALHDPAAVELRGYPEDREIASMSSANSDVVSTSGSASDLSPAPLRWMSRANTSKSVVSREKRSPNAGTVCC
jgi:hypothetical protein